MEDLLRKRITSVIKKLYERGLISARSGNVSCRLNASTMLITPSGTVEDKMKPSGIVKMGLDGRVLQGRIPSIEWMMHAEVYRRNKQVGAIIHSHPPITIGLSLSGEFKVVTEECKMLVGYDIPMVRAPPGSEELARAVASESSKKVVILLGHGLVAFGRDLEEAEILTEAVEENAKVVLVYIVSRINPDGSS
ncbi:MAG: class II aldolase/adducin family protein [Candidatus Hadarchaeales archaeon]